MPSPAFTSLPLPPRRRRRRRPRQPPTCTLPTLLDLTSSNTLTLLPRRRDYLTTNPDAHYAEPELIALVSVSHHVSPENTSAAAVRAAITRIRPDAVVVELCRSRAAMLNPPPSPAKLPAPARALLHLLRLARAPPALLADRLLQLHRTAPGAEFRAAREAAQRVGATLVLGDRRIAVTLRRAWRALSLSDRLVLAVTLARVAVGLAPPVERLDDPVLKHLIETGASPEADDVVRTYVEKLGERFPGVVKPLVEERDHYLAWSLKRSQAVRGAKVVVGVVGRAHVDGIVRACRDDDERRRRGERPLLLFRDLVK